MIGFWELPPLAVWAPEHQPHRQWLNKAERHRIRQAVRRADRQNTYVALGSLDVREARATETEARKRRFMGALSYHNEAEGISTAWWLRP